MKKKLFPGACALLVLVSVGLSGCPVYDDDSEGCYDDYDCSSGYYCDYPTGACLRYGPSDSNECNAPSDCAANETCSKSGICAEGDCHFKSVGCVSGFECSSARGFWECVREGSGTGDGGAPASSGGAPSAGAPSASAGAPASDGGEPSVGGAPPQSAGAGAGGN
jgi:hypothetical protein